MQSYTLLPVTGIGEVTTGADLVALVADHVRDGDIVVITSKVVSKAEGRVRTLGSFDPDPATAKEAAVAVETDREVARRTSTRIVRNRLGLTMAAAGVDTSNTSAGTVVLLPLDPDHSARRIRAGLALLPTRPNVGVILSDTAGRAWREGQTDIAIGVAGLEPAHSHAGAVDAYGNPLLVTLPATADEIAGAAEVAAGKLSGVPFVVVRGLAERILPAGEHGPGAAALIRPEHTDMFGLGTREAVMAALTGQHTRGFGAAARAEELVEALGTIGLEATIAADGAVLTGADVRAPVVAHAHGWRPDTPPRPDTITIRLITDTTLASST